MKNLLALVSVAIALCVTGCDGHPEHQPKTATVHKAVYAAVDPASLFGGKGVRPLPVAGRSSCYAIGGLIKKGYQVIVRDDSGATLALGVVGPGVLSDEKVSGQIYPWQTGKTPCVFKVTIGDVPIGHKFYDVQVGAVQPITVSEAELRDPGRRITFD